MEFVFQHERERTRRITEFEDGKRLLPEPKPGVELTFDAMVSILIRLPARHLRRMRSMCKSWSLLISDRHFISEYSKFRTSVTKRPCIMSLYTCFDEWKCSYKLKFFPEGDDYHHEFVMFRDLGAIQSCKMSNSCDGLICVVGGPLTYLLNPSIQRSALLRRFMQLNMPEIVSAGLGFNDSTGEYKVVQLFRHDVGQHSSLGCEVYTVGNLHSPSFWKVIDIPPFELPLCGLPIFVNGAIHWTVNSDCYVVQKTAPPEIALSFDVKSEKFDVILHPEGSSRPPCSRVVELGGLLCVAGTHCDRVRMDIWVLKDYDNREWMRQYIIDLSTMHDYLDIAFSTKPVVVQDGKIVFCTDYGSRDYYDPQSKSFVEHMHIPPDFAYHIACTVNDTAYTESIVWPVEAHASGHSGWDSRFL